MKNKFTILKKISLIIFTIFMRKQGQFKIYNRNYYKNSKGHINLVFASIHVARTHLPSGKTNFSLFQNLIELKQ